MGRVEDAVWVVVLFFGEKQTVGWGWSFEVLLTIYCSALWWLNTAGRFRDIFLGVF